MGDVKTDDEDVELERAVAALQRQSHSGMWNIDDVLRWLAVSDREQERLRADLARAIGERDEAIEAHRRYEDAVNEGHEKDFAISRERDERWLSEKNRVEQEWRDITERVEAELRAALASAQGMRAALEELRLDVGVLGPGLMDTTRRNRVLAKIVQTLTRSATPPSAAVIEGGDAPEPSNRLYLRALSDVRDAVTTPGQSTAPTEATGEDSAASTVGTCEASSRPAPSTLSSAAASNEWNNYLTALEAARQGHSINGPSAAGASEPKVDPPLIRDRRLAVEAVHGKEMADDTFAHHEKHAAFCVTENREASVVRALTIARNEERLTPPPGPALGALVEAARAVLTELDIIRRSERPGLLVHIDTHADLAAALAALPPTEATPR